MRARAVSRAAAILLDIFVNPLNLIGPTWPWAGVVIPLSLLLAGGVSLARRSPRVWGMLVVPIALAMVASAGALEALLDLTLRHANERVAFERPIGKFQAVQHSLARLAGEVAAAMTAAGSAADALAHAHSFDDAVFLEVAAAKIRTAQAAAEGAAIAHQIHGAIGFTREHILHRFTLRLLAWRDDFGNESHWAAALGNCVAARGAEEFWPLLASR